MTEYVAPVPAFIVEFGDGREPEFIATVADRASYTVPAGGVIRRFDPPADVAAEAATQRLATMDGERAPVPDWLPVHPDHVGVCRAANAAATHVGYWPTRWEAVHGARKRAPVSRYLAALPQPPAPHEISALASRYIAAGMPAGGAEITRDEGVIYDAYRARVGAEGSGVSCMCHGDGARAAAIAYGGANSNLALAVLRDGAGDIVARAVVWPARREYARIYASAHVTCAQLREWLNAEGYVRASNYWAGARIHIEPTNGSFDTVRMPYLDFAEYVDPDGYCYDDEPENTDYYSARHTSGWSKLIEAGEQCDVCGDHTPHHALQALLEGGVVCRWCIDSSSSVNYCDHGQDYTCEDTETVGVWQGDRVVDEQWRESVVQQQCFYCDITEQYYDESVARVVTTTGETAALWPCWKAGLIEVLGFAAADRMPIWERVE